MEAVGGNAMLMERMVLPIALPTTLLLGVLRVLTSVSGLGEVAWEVLFRGRGAVGEALVVAVVGLVAASHYLICVSGTL